MQLKTMQNHQSSDCVQAMGFDGRLYFLQPVFLRQYRVLILRIHHLLQWHEFTKYT